MIRASKRSRWDQQPSSSKTTIDILPDLVLVEILCRLLHNKVAFQCKLVSKRWCTLLSDPYFVNRFLHIQHDQQKPVQNHYIMIPSEFAHRNTLVLTMSSEPLPLSEASIKTSIFSVFPCFQSRYYFEKDNKFYVEGTYNDLVLCTQGYPNNVFYICNCYTKEWTRLPPTPRGRPSDELTTTGFICEPYYNINEEGTTSNCSAVKLDAEYRCRVVRFIQSYKYNNASMEIFSFMEIFFSETGEWREYCLSRILDQQQRFLLSTLAMSRGIACNGKLYWLTDEGSVFEFDPFNICSTSSDADVIDKCRFIDSPTLRIPDMYISRWHIGVCRGRLQMCPEFFEFSQYMVIWELKENEVDGKPEWCLLHQITFMSEMDPKRLVSRFRMVGFHPIHRDLVYLHHHTARNCVLRHVVMCNVREKTLEIATEIPSDENSDKVPSMQIVPCVIPWWPTPVPTSRNHREEKLSITVTVIGTGVDKTFTFKLGSFCTVKQLKQELEEKRGHRELDLKLHCDGRTLNDDDKWLGDYGIKNNSNIYYV